MEFNELKARYAKRPDDGKILEWVLENVKEYVQRKQYPDHLAPESVGGWDPDGYRTLWVGFLKGRKVKDRKTGSEKTVYEYNLAYILDTCNNMRSACLLLQKQVHFYFQKTRESGVAENIARRVRKIFRTDNRLHVFNESESNATYGLMPWIESDPGIWDADFKDLYQLVYANLGDYVHKSYGQLSSYESPEIADKDLTEILCNLVTAADKRLTLNQIMYVLGYKLDIREPEIESLQRETEEQRALLETVPIDDISPYERMVYLQTAEEIYTELPEPLRELLPHLQVTYDVKELVKRVNRPESTIYEQLGRIKRVFNKHVKNKYDLKSIWDILAEKYFPS